MTANVWVRWLTVLIFDTVHSDRAPLSNNFPLGLGLIKNNSNYYYYYYTILPPTILNAYYGPENELCVCYTLSYLILTIEVRRGAVISQCHTPTKPRSWHCELHEHRAGLPERLPNIWLMHRNMALTTLTYGCKLPNAPKRWLPRVLKATPSPTLITVSQSMQESAWAFLPQIF